MESYINEMEGKILILDNKKFVFCLGFVGIYYVSFLCVLGHMILQSGGFH